MVAGGLFAGSGRVGGMGLCGLWKVRRVTEVWVNLSTDCEVGKSLLLVRTDWPGEF